MSITSDPECLFCKIVAGEIPSERVYEDDDILVFKDIAPQAPFHALVIPKTHISTLNDLSPEQVELAGRLFLVAKSVAQDQGFAEAGYRVVVSTNKGGGQVVFHIHMHLLAGREMRWPPG